MANISSFHPDFPGTNQVPAEQAQVQMTVCPDWHSLNRSYRLRGSTDASSHKTYFQPKMMVTVDPTAFFHVKQNEIVWCLKKDLIGTNIATAAFHATNKSKMLRVRSSFNNYIFPPEIQILINYLSGLKNHCNEKYIAEIVANAIMPLGFSKSEFSFQDRALAGVDQPLEINCGGTVLAFVRDSEDSLRVETKARIAVPTPSQWNNSTKFYKDRENVQGKITLYLQSLSVNKDKRKLESIFAGFFGNDTMRVESRLKHIIDCGHTSIQPLYAIPVFFHNLVSTIVIDTYQRGISTGFLKLNNKFKYAHILQAFKDLLPIFGDIPQPAFSTLVAMVFENIKDESEMISLLVVAAINRIEGIGFTDEMIVNEASRAYIRVGKPADPDQHQTMMRALKLFNNYHLDIKLKTNSDFVSNNGYDESDWDKILSSYGDEALDWTDIFYFTSIDKKPLQTEDHRVLHNGQIGMFGDYELDVLHDPLVGWHNIPEEKLMDKRHDAAMNFTTIASQIFNLTIPCESRVSSGDALAAEGHLFRHRKNPEAATIIQDCTNKAHRFSLEICKSLLSEILPTDQREVYRTGYDRQKDSNAAMVIDHFQNFTFDHRTMLGRISESLSEVFSCFTEGVADFYLNDKMKAVMSVIEPNVRGNRAVAYLKQ